MGKLVDSSHSHLWSDALHIRTLARQARNKWDRGTYVRCAITTAWTAFEVACEDALNCEGLGHRFRTNLDQAIRNLHRPPLSWGAAPWQKVLEVHKRRKNYVHIAIPQEGLFPDATEADTAIATLRDAMRAIYAHVGKSPPAWVDDDQDPGWDRGVRDSCDLMLVRNGVDENDPGAIKVSIVSKGKESVFEILPPDTDPVPVMKDIVEKTILPLNRVKAYRGAELIEDWDLPMRGN